MQVNEEFRQKSISKGNNLSNIYHPIKESFSNTMIPFGWIEKYVFQYQSMLKKIADYLLNEKIWWEENTNGVVFYDIDNNDQEKTIHHFRSSTLKAESKYLDKSWEQGLQDMPNKILAFKIKVHNSDTSEIIHMKTLKHFANEENKPVCTNENKPVYTNDTLNVSLTPMGTTPNFNIYNISETDISSSHVSDTNSISSVADSISIPATGTPSQPNNILVNKILSSTPVSKKKYPTSSYQKYQRCRGCCINAKKVSLQDENNKKPTLSGLSETSRRLLQIFGENEIIFDFDKCRKNIKVGKMQFVFKNIKKLLLKWKSS